MRTSVQYPLLAALVPLLLALSACAGPAAAEPVAVPAPPAAVPVRITNADPAMEYRPETAAAGLPAGYTAEQITGAQRTVIRFLADEAIGTGFGDSASWWEANRARFAPAYRAEAFAAARTPDGGLLMPPLPGETLAGRTITVEQVAESPGSAITVAASFDATYLGRSGTIRHVHGTASGAVVADALTGAWLIETFAARAEPAAVPA